jgi:IS30 family transposase
MPAHDLRASPESQRSHDAAVIQSGRWEGDTVVGADMRHCLLTLVERVSGYVVIK